MGWRGAASRRARQRGKLPAVKVLHLINTLSAGGAELHLLSLCRELRRRDVDVSVACLREQVRDSRSLRRDFEAEGIPVADLRAASRYDWRFPSRLLALLRQERPNILHTHLPRADFAGVLARQLRPTLRWVSSVHNIHSGSWSARWVLPLFGPIWRRSDGLIAISHAVKRWLVGAYGVPSQKITVIHYGIRTDAFAAENRGHDGPGARAVIGSLARLEPRKGHETLVRAMPMILGERPDACLRIAGHDVWGHGRKIRALISDLHLQENVQVVGFQRDVPAFLHDLDVFAFASRSEGFGQVLLEAMAAGAPVVASRIAPFDEIVVDGDTGVLVEAGAPRAFATAILRLLDHPLEAAQMARQALERVRSHFSVGPMADHTASLYEQLA